MRRLPSIVYLGSMIGAIIATWTATTWPDDAQITVTEATVLAIGCFLMYLHADGRRRAAEAERDSKAEAERRRAQMRAGSWLN